MGKAVFTLLLRCNWRGGYGDICSVDHESLAMTTHPTPTKPGYYWAKMNGSDRWQPVEIWMAMGLGLSLAIIGERHSFRLSDFTFGPEVTKPDGLE